MEKEPNMPHKKSNIINEIKKYNTYQNKKIFEKEDR